MEEAHGRQSLYGGNIAPPMFLNAVSEGQAIVGLPGLVATYVGAAWEWQRVIRVEDRDHLVELELGAENQRGQVTMTGSAQVILPAPGQMAPARA